MKEPPVRGSTSFVNPRIPCSRGVRPLKIVLQIRAESDSSPLSRYPQAPCRMRRARLGTAPSSSSGTSVLQFMPSRASTTIGVREPLLSTVGARSAEGAPGDGRLADAFHRDQAARPFLARIPGERSHDQGDDPRRGGCAGPPTRAEHDDPDQGRDHREGEVLEDPAPGEKRTNGHVLVGHAQAIPQDPHDIEGDQAGEQEATPAPEESAAQCPACGGPHPEHHGGDESVQHRRDPEPSRRRARGGREPTRWPGSRERERA